MAGLDSGSALVYRAIFFLGGFFCSGIQEHPLLEHLFCFVLLLYNDLRDKSTPPCCQKVGNANKTAYFNTQHSERYLYKPQTTIWG
jgi:hypothetical protein